MQNVDSARILLVGLGGLGCPAALSLLGAGVRHLGVADDDEVEIANLHRQIVYEEADVGKPKVDAFIARIADSYPAARIEAHRTRLLPENAQALVSDYDLVIEGADNFATKFLCADACYLAGVPVVSASVVRWAGFVFGSGPQGGAPCYRCVFEDIPDDAAATCDSAGVMAPVVGILAALQANLALEILSSPSAGGVLIRFDGKSDAHRRSRITPRRDCLLCGETASIHGLERARYVRAPSSGTC